MQHKTEYKQLQSKIMVHAHWSILNKAEMLFVAVCLTCIPVISAADWSYSGDLGPSTWKERYPSCGGSRQSPININTRSDNITTVPSNSHRVKWHHYNKAPISMKLINNGHSVQLKATPKSGQTPFLELDNRIYELDQVHFHWGRKDKDGSEHTLNNKRFPLELHAVHRLTVNGSLVSPAEIIVITILFEMSILKNIGLERFLRYVPLVRLAETEVEIPPFPADTLIPPFESFFFYKGSLTTPPCSEVVTFHIRKELSNVSFGQLLLLRLPRNEEGEELAGNFRPVQPTNGRTIYEIHN